MPACRRLDQSPAGQPADRVLLGRMPEVDRSQIVWGQIGPRLMAEAVTAVGVPVRMLDPAAFYPIDYWNVWQLISAAHLPPSCDAIHLWNSRWRREGLDPDAVYAPTCVYEQLKRRYGTGSPREAGRGPGWRSFARHGWRQLRRNRVPLLRQKQCVPGHCHNTASDEAVAHRDESRKAA